jgi:DNA-binding MarR family transcriptional regulator
VAHTSASRLLALHALRLKGFADAAPLASAAGLSPAELTKTLAELDRAGLVTRREGRVRGWSLSPSGRAEHERLVAMDVEDSGRRSDLDDGYRRFLELNGELLETCTAWQLKTAQGIRIVNDHSDPEYDQEVTERLAAVHVAARPIWQDLAAALARFAPYGVRLQRAFDRVAAGDGDWFTRPVIDSYHTIWFELHEDLLSSLGIERAQEAAR